MNMNNKILGARQCHETHAPAYWKAVFREYKDRLEKAEQERDEARANAYNWEATAEEWEKRALAAESRPLAPDAITDETVRDPLAFFDAHRSLWGIKEARKEFIDKHLSYSDVRRIVELSFTPEPPARPEGAEEIEALIREHVKASPGTDDASIANWLAERGVRVTGGN